MKITNSYKLFREKIAAHRSPIGHSKLNNTGNVKQKGKTNV